LSNPQDFRARYLRWLIVLTLNQARPTGAPDRLVLQVAQAEYADCTLLELRRELDYLRARDLIELLRPPDGSAWHAQLTRHGVDLAEYTVDCEPGIARPARYW
jgi:hypothetical protein